MIAADDITWALGQCADRLTMSLENKDSWTDYETGSETVERFECCMNLVRERLLWLLSAMRAHDPMEVNRESSFWANPLPEDDDDEEYDEVKERRLLDAEVYSQVLCHHLPGVVRH